MKVVLLACVLFLLFTGRCLAQLFQSFFNVSWLPGFNEFQSGAASYPILLLSQIIILILGWHINYCLVTKKQPLKFTSKKWFFLISVFYLLIMFLRLALGLTIFKQHFFFSALIPAAFHLILASWMMLVSRTSRELYASKS